MKQLKNWSILMLMVMAMPLMVACGDDEYDENTSLLRGEWSSYKADIFSRDGGVDTYYSDKTTDGYALSFSCVFNNNGRGVISIEEKGSIISISEFNFSYSLKGNDVKLTLLEKGDATEFVWNGVIDSKNKPFVLHLTPCYWMDLTADVYFRK